MTKVTATVDEVKTTQYFDTWAEAVEWAAEFSKGLQMVKFKFEKMEGEE